MNLITCLFIMDKSLLKKCNRIYDKFKRIIKKELETEPVCNEKYLKTEMKFDKGKLNTNFQANEISRE